jgi:RNA polymerase sigma-70 factor (ECF subfamily)
VEFESFDQAYLDRLSAGDPETEGHFNRYFSELLRIKLRARRYTQDVVEDLRQETFLRVVKALRRGEIREAGSIGAFVNSVCKFVIMEHDRAQSKHQPVEEGVAEPRDERADSEQSLFSAERRAMVRAVLESLSPKNRSLLQAAFLEELSTDELCRRFQVEPSYLRVLLFRARQQFRSAIDRRNGGIA